MVSRDGRRIGAVVDVLYEVQIDRYKGELRRAGSDRTPGGAGVMA